MIGGRLQSFSECLSDRLFAKLAVRWDQRRFAASADQSFRMCIAMGLSFDDSNLALFWFNPKGCTSNVQIQSLEASLPRPSNSPAKCRSEPSAI